MTGRSAPPHPPRGSTNPGPPLVETPPTTMHTHTHRFLYSSTIRHVYSLSTGTWRRLQQPIREQRCTHMVFLYPGEQTVESEAGPVGCVVAPPENIQ